MRLDLAPARVPLTPGTPAELTLTITNTSDVVDGYAVRVLGLDPGWITVADPRPRLFPGETTTVAITVRAPEELPAGPRRIGVQVREQAGQQGCEVRDAVLEVVGRRAVGVRLDPRIVTGGRRATYSAVVENTGNTTVDGHLTGLDPEQRLRFACKPDGFSLAPGGQVVLALRASGRRRLTGSPTPRQFDVRVGDGPAPPPQPRRRANRRPLLQRRRKRPPAAPAAPAPPSDPPDAIGVFVQRPVLGRGALGLAGLVAAVTVFASVITIAMAGLASRSAADRDLALAVAQARDSDARTGTSSLAGHVRVLSSGADAKNVSVEVFGDADPAAALATTATDDTGAFKVTALPAGTYKLRVRGAGFAETWYPAAPTAADATPVDLGESHDITGLTVLVGGVPARIAGTVLPPETPAAALDGGRAPGADLTGVLVQLQLPLDLPPLVDTVRPEPGEARAPSPSPSPSAGAGAGPGPAGVTAAGSGSTSGAVVATVTLAADGAFDLTDVPSPAVYDLVVNRPGAGAQVTRLDVAAGESRVGLRIQLRRGDGAIAGSVRDAHGPVAGATITATSGTTVIRTTSGGAPEATFALRELPTPATYTLTVTAPGRAPTTLALSLAAGQQLTGVQVQLGAAGGALTGTVTVKDVHDAGDITVTATDGAVTLQTVTKEAPAPTRSATGDTSSDPTGTWALTGLPVPGTYTISFTRDDLQTEVRSVSLDASGRPVRGSAEIPVTMRRAAATLHGLTCTPLRAGATSSPSATAAVQHLGGVTITATSSDGQWTTTSTTSGEPFKSSTTSGEPFKSSTTSGPCGEDDGSGTYVLAGLPAGLYTVEFSVPGIDPVVRQLRLEPGDEQQLDVRLDNTGSIAGHVSRAGESPTCTGDKAGDGSPSHLVVELWAVADYPRAGTPRSTVGPACNGTFAFPHLPAGRYLVAVREMVGGDVLATSRIIDLGPGGTDDSVTVVVPGAAS